MQSDQAADAIAAAVRQAASLYHRLVLVVGPASAGKTDALEAVRKRTGAPLVNLGLELSRRMLELTADQRPLQLRPVLTQLVETLDEGGSPALLDNAHPGHQRSRGAQLDKGGSLLLLDNIELLFDPTLKQDPLHLLQGLSRNKIIVAAWTGALEDGKLRYAAAGHPEHRQYPARDLLAVPFPAGGQAT